MNDRENDKPTAGDALVGLIIVLVLMLMIYGVAYVAGAGWAAGAGG